MITTEQKIASKLLSCKAIKLQPNNPFTWASGWKSPIYCDNRVTLSYPEIRSAIRDEFVDMIKTQFPGVTTIAGVATGAIAQGALIADAMSLPFIYIRSSAKSHGMENLIEGKLEPNATVVVIEDLVSTGGSSLKAVQALKDAGANVLGMCAIFTYGFNIASQNFAEQGCRLFTLTNYEQLINTALETKYIMPDQVELLKNWRQDPANWKP